MKTNTAQKSSQFTTLSATLFWIGFTLVFGLTFKEVINHTELNFKIFTNATLDFWNGISPYDFETWSQRHGLDFFLYGPLFNILFAPFAFLPSWLGPFVWNLFNYSLFFWSIKTLPDRFTEKQKSNTFLYLFLILACSLLSFQYNVAVAYLFIFAYSLLEKNKPFWAIILILISGGTKIYGIFQLSMLIFYPKFWRNMGYVAIGAIILFVLPALKLGFDDLIPHYTEWIEQLGAHKDTRTWQTFFYIKLLFPNGAPHYMSLIQIGVLSLLAIIVITSFKKYSDPNFRVRALGVLMGYVILFSNSSERHTYLIALLGYALWYTSMQPNWAHKALFILNGLVLIAMPVDLICPPFIMNYFFETLNINLWLYLCTWIIMIASLLKTSRGMTTLPNKTE